MPHQFCQPEPNLIKFGSIEFIRTVEIPLIVCLKASPMRFIIHLKSNLGGFKFLELFNYGKPEK